MANLASEQTTDESGRRALRAGLIAAAVGVTGVILWVVLVYADVALNSYVGRDLRTDLRVILPPLIIVAVLMAGAIRVLPLATRRGGARLRAGGLLLFDAAFGAALLYFAGDAAARSIEMHRGRAIPTTMSGVPAPAAPDSAGSTSSAVPQLPVIPAPSAPSAVVVGVDSTFPADSLRVELRLAYACAGNPAAARLVEASSGSAMPEAGDVCLVAFDEPGPCPACEAPFKSYEPGPEDTPESIAESRAIVAALHREEHVEPANRAVEAHRRWLDSVHQRFGKTHRLHVRIGEAANPSTEQASDTLFLYGYLAAYERNEDLTVHEPPRRDSLFLRALGALPLTEPVDRWLDVPWYHGAVYGVLVAPSAVVAQRRLAAIAIPGETVGPRACYDVDAPPPLRAAQHEISIPPRLCLCCVQ